MATQLTFNRARQVLRRTASKRLEPLGFRHIIELSFVRTIPEGLALIHFSIRRGSHKELCFSFGVGSAFPLLSSCFIPMMKSP